MRASTRRVLRRPSVRTRKHLEALCVWAKGQAVSRIVRSWCSICSSSRVAHTALLSRHERLWGSCQALVRLHWAVSARVGVRARTLDLVPSLPPRQLSFGFWARHTFVAQAKSRQSISGVGRTGQARFWIPHKIVVPSSCEHGDSLEGLLPGACFCYVLARVWFPVSHVSHLGDDVIIRNPLGFDWSVMYLRAGFASRVRSVYTPHERHWDICW